MRTDEFVAGIEEGRVLRAKISFATHRVPSSDMCTVIEGNIKPDSGDLVLARVEKLGHHTRLELPDGRRAKLFAGDEIIVCYGNRYASAQFEAVVGEDLSPCHLVAGGGIAGMVRVSHRSARPPTRIVPVGLLGDKNGKRLNLRDYALSPRASAGSVPSLAVVGNAMSCGKTTTAANIVKGLVRAGYDVGAAKVTGTGAGGDRWSLVDAGARPVIDFTDAGYASTYRLDPQQIEDIFGILVGHLAENGSDIAVLEIADGLFQKETRALLGSSRFQQNVGAIVLAADSAVSAVAGVQWLTEQTLPVVAVGGLFTRSPLAVEEAKGWTSLPILKVSAFSDPKRGSVVWKRLIDDGWTDSSSNVHAIHSTGLDKEKA